MSWEYSEAKHACPCGHGTYTETTGSNDWGQSSSGWKMDCPSCKLNYALYTYEYYRHGMRSEGYRWISKQSYDKAMELLSKVERLKNRAVTLASSRYFDTLVTQFENSSKKAVWEVLHANIKSFKSLGTFYQHTKGKNKREYLAELFSDHQLGDVFKIIRVSDEEIQKLRTQAKTLEKEAEQFLHGN
jgi:hypothetical protein